MNSQCYNTGQEVLWSEKADRPLTHPGRDPKEMASKHMVKDVSKDVSKVKDVSKALLCSEEELLRWREYQDLGPE